MSAPAASSITFERLAETKRLPFRAGHRDRTQAAPTANAEYLAGIEDQHATLGQRLDQFLPLRKDGVRGLREVGTELIREAVPQAAECHLDRSGVRGLGDRRVAPGS